MRGVCLLEGLQMIPHKLIKAVSIAGGYVLVDLHLAAQIAWSGFAKCCSHGHSFMTHLLHS